MGPRSTNNVVIGLDLGQRHDYTAIAIVEVESRLRDGVSSESTETSRPPADVTWMPSSGIAIAQPHPARPRRWDDHYLVHRLERLPLGTSYPQVAARMVQVCAGVANRTGRWPTLYVDATGLGRPVVDLIQDAGVQASVRAVTLTSGDRRIAQGGEISLGKAYLVSALQAALQTGRLHLPTTAEAATLREELLTYEIKVTEAGNDTFGAFRVGSHDDLVTALGLAVAARPAVRWGVT